MVEQQPVIADPHWWRPRANLDVLPARSRASEQMVLAELHAPMCLHARERRITDPDAGRQCCVSARQGCVAWMGHTDARPMDHRQRWPSIRSADRRREHYGVLVV